ncbi:aldo/keto reductase [Amycolatopsis sacchari]|uniref:aldo/keto reductase n=1 Tax=Amycolatopsis sacchari TaxID=115433 RepID=UPI003D70CA29
MPRTSTRTAPRRRGSGAEKIGCTSAQLALLWSLRKASVTSTIIGSSRAGQLEENVAIGDFEVTEDDLEKAGEILRPVALT